MSKFREFDENLREYLWHKRGVTKTSLLYTIRQQSAVEETDRCGTVGSGPNDAYPDWTEYAIRCTIHANSHWSKDNNTLWGILFKLVGSGPGWSYIQSFGTKHGVGGDSRKAYFALYSQAYEATNVKLIVEAKRQFIRESVYTGDSKHYNFDRHKRLWHDAKQTLIRYGAFPPEDQFVYDFVRSLQDVRLEQSIPNVITEESDYYANFEKASAYLTRMLGVKKLQNQPQKRGRNVSAFTNNKKRKGDNKCSNFSSNKPQGNNNNNNSGGSKAQPGTYKGPVECKFYPREVWLSMSQEQQQKVRALKQARNASNSGGNQQLKVAAATAANPPNNHSSAGNQFGCHSHIGNGNGN